MTISLVKLIYEWEVQLLVLISFALQMFLFFTGSLRRRKTNMFLRVCIWTAYLGADWVAVYALGYLSGVHEDITIARHRLRRTKPLSFFWAPFLLIHLGGQDTITAFAMEDNDLWLRHFLNLLVQVFLAVRVFWKSAGKLTMELIASSAFVFVAGVIKYGERTWSLKCGSSKSLESSTGHHYKQPFPELKDSDRDYCKTVLNALCSMFSVLNVFAARNHSFSYGRDDNSPDTKRMFKVVELELAMMYDDLYTKALVLRTKTGMILRCISHTCSFVAFALFMASDKMRYHRVDIAITYSLFIGGFFLDLSAMFIVIMSPWTWVWLKAQKYKWLASLSWFLFSSGIGWPAKRPMWSNSIGQYNLLSWVSGGDNKPRSCNQKVMVQVRRLVSLAGVGKENLFWMSKMLDTEYVEADNNTMEIVVKGINRIHDEFSKVAREWPKLGPFLENIRVYFAADFGAAIVVIHKFTEEYMKAAESLGQGGRQEGNTRNLMEVCRKLSNYMMYLFVNNPSMLPLNTSSEATLAKVDQLKEKLIRVDPSEEALEEMVDMWTRLLIYSAGKSKGPMHAAELSRGGELITFVWLLMVKAGLGDSEAKRILIANSASAGTNLKEAYAFYFAQ